MTLQTVDEMMEEIQYKNEAYRAEWVALVAATVMILAGSLLVLLGLVWYFI